MPKPPRPPDSVFLRLLGPPRIEGPAGALPGPPAQRHRLALLALLARAPLHILARDKLMGMLWPEADTGSARQLLNASVYELRRALGARVLLSDGDALRLDVTRVHVDVMEFEALLAEGDAAGATEIWTGPFLDGFALPNAVEFDHWAELEREQLERRYQVALEQCAEELGRAGERERAAEVWQRRFARTPADGRVVQRLMEALDRAGDRAGALRAAEGHAALLREEFDAEPDTNVTALTERLRRPERSESAQFVGPHHSPENGGDQPAEAAAGRGSGRRGGGVVLHAAPDEAPPTPATDGLASPDAFRRIEPARRGLWLGILRDRAAALGFATLITGSVVYAVLDGSWHLNGLQGTPSGLTACEGRPEGCNALPLDPARFVILPLAQDSGWGRPGDGAVLGLLIGENMHLLGASTVDPLRVSDAVNRVSNSRHIPLDTAVALARRLGAGRLVLGEIRVIGDSGRVRLALYDTESTRRPIASATLHAHDGSGLDDIAARLAKSLLETDEVDGVRVERSAAAEEYTRGEAALLSWDLSAAASHFRKALILDPRHARAHLQLAHALNLAGDTGVTFRAASTAARKYADQLAPRDRQLLAGLDALAHHEYPLACEQFTRLIERDSLDFAGWLGLGDCHASDALVLPDSTSPSQWRFRSSHHSALHAYNRALALLPSFNFALHSLRASRLSAVLSLDPSFPRRGLTGGGERFAAFAAIRSGSDTLSYIPYHWTALLAGRPGEPAEYAAGTMKIRELALRIARAWAEAFPRAPESLEAYALALESVDAIRVRPDGFSALVAVEQAAKVAGDPDQRFRLAMMRLRFLLKTEDYRRAGRLADSLLRTNPIPTPGQAQQLAAAAALRGRVQRVADLLALETPRLQNEFGGVPASVIEDHLRLLAHAAMGWPSDSMRVLWHRVEDGIRAGVPPQQHDVVNAQLNTRAASLSFPILGPTVLHRSAQYSTWRLELQSAQARRDTAAIRRGVARHQANYVDVGPQPASIDAELHIALLCLAIGDTAAAIRTLDSVLNHLGMAHPRLTSDVAQAASLVRMMGLRAELAARAGEHAVVRRWANAVQALWQDGDSDARAFAEAVRRYRAGR